MSGNHNEQPTELTYPNEAVNTIQLVVYDSDQEQTAKPNVRWEDITFTLVEQNSSSDKENDGGLIKVEEDVGISNSESQVLPTNVTPPPRTAERADRSVITSGGTVQERTGFAHPFAKYLKKEDRYIIEALITSEPLTKSLTKLLTSPVYLEYSLNQQKNNN